MPDDLAGIHFMMPTPFDDHGRVDEESIPPLVELAARAGCRGVVCLGVMGEFTRLSDAERTLVLRRTVEAAAGRLTVTVGTTSPGTDLAILRSREAQDAGATAVMVSPPPLPRPNLDAVFAYYQSLDRHVALPIVVQDYPREIGVFLPAPFIARLHGELARCHYLKLEDAPTPPKVGAVRDLTGGRMGVFGGLGGAYLLEELSRGACGTMTGFAYPEILVRVYQHWVKGEREQARGVFYRYLPLIRYEAQEGIGLALRKEALKRRGVIRSARVRHPGAGVDDATRRELYETIDAMEL